MVAGIACETRHLPQQEVNTAECLGSFEIPEGSQVWQVEIVLDDECAKFLVHFLPKAFKPGDLMAGRAALSTSFSINSGN